MSAVEGWIGNQVRALGFLSRIPLPSRFFESGDGDLSRLARFFPTAGALIALPPAALLAFLLLFGTKPELAALLALTVQILLTGALHEDGLADCADGFGGGRDKQHMLEIMKDSRMGAYGGLALVLSVAIRLEAIAGIAEAAGTTAAALSLVAINALSRAAMVRHWTGLPPAKTSGVAAASGQPQKRDCNIAWISGLVVYVVLGLSAAGLQPTFWGLVAVIVSTIGFAGLTRGKIGGHTGDTLGAMEQIAQIAAIAALAIAL